MSIKRVLLLLIAVAAFSLFAGKVKFITSTDKKDAVYKVGDTITITAKITEDGKPAVNRKLGYRLMYDQKTIKCGLTEGTEELTFTVKATHPGWVYLKIFAFGNSKGEQRYAKMVTIPNRYIRASYSGGIGAMIEPEKLRHSQEEPADFDEFWNKVKAELAAVPMKELERKDVPEKLLKAAKVQADKFNFSDVKVSCAGGMPVSGYLAIPKGAKAKSLPALVTFHGAGVRSARLSCNNGVIVFDVNAHGIINGQPEEYYKKLYNEKYTDKKLGTYPRWGKKDRDQFYFKGMYMRVMRALEYVKSLPEWDGKTLIVSGGSQGGAQVLAACALDHDITLARAKVPALCDHFAAKSGRCPGWPQIINHKMPGEKFEPEKVAACVAYYDGIYFAKRIKCPIYLYTGFIDTTCPPNGVFAAYNNIPEGVKKSIYCVPTAGHSVPENQFYKIMQLHIRKGAKK